MPSGQGWKWQGTSPVYLNFEQKGDFFFTGVAEKTKNNKLASRNAILVGKYDPPTDQVTERGKVLSHYRS